MRTTPAVLVALVFGLIPAAAMHALAPRIVFERVLPPAHDLGPARDIAIVEAPASDPRIELFVEQFVRQVNRSGTLTLRDMRTGTGPADAHLNIETFRCESAVRETEGAVRDVDGKRVKQRAYQIDAVCGARIEVLSRFLKPMSTYFARGEGTSRRLESVTDEERENAIADAAHRAAADAAERITPRRVRESIALDDSAPAFEEGMAMIEAGRLAEARDLATRDANAAAFGGAAVQSRGGQRGARRSTCGGGALQRGAAARAVGTAVRERAEAVRAADAVAFAGGIARPTSERSFAAASRRINNLPAAHGSLFGRPP